MTIEKTYELPFSPEVVYAAWVSSDTVIAPATSMDIEPVAGGHYRLIMESAEFSSKNEGMFLVVEPGRHLTYTWEWNDDGEVSEIDVTFKPSDSGTVVALLHSGFLKPESVAMHADGWDSYMRGFTAFLENQN